MRKIELRIPAGQRHTAGCAHAGRQCCGDESAYVVLLVDADDVIDQWADVIFKQEFAKLFSRSGQGQSGQCPCRGWYVRQAPVQGGAKAFQSMLRKPKLIGEMFQNRAVPGAAYFDVLMAPALYFDALIALA